MKFLQRGLDLLFPIHFLFCDILPWGPSAHSCSHRSQTHFEDSAFSTQISKPEASQSPCSEQEAPLHSQPASVWTSIRDFFVRLHSSSQTEKHLVPFPRNKASRKYADQEETAGAREVAEALAAS